MTTTERAFKALCEALVRITGGDVAAYRRKVEAMRDMNESEVLEQLERQIRFRRKQIDEGK